MDFFDDFGDKLRQTGKQAARKTKGFAESVRLNALIAEEERRLSHLYTMIGMAYCCTPGERKEAELRQLSNKVMQSRNIIESFRREIESAKESSKLQSDVPYNGNGMAIFCNACGAGVMDGQKFCTACGSEIPVKQRRKCVQCGCNLPADAMFCNKCGHAAEIE